MTSERTQGLFTDPTDAEIDKRKRSGESNNKIGIALGMTREAVRKRVAKNPLIHRTSAELAQPYWPIKISGFNQSSTKKWLHLHLRYMISGGSDFSEYSRSRLRAFYTRLRRGNLIAVFDPNIDPSEEDKAGGWDLMPRTGSDNDLVLRRNQYVEQDDSRFYSRSRRRTLDGVVYMSSEYYEVALPGLLIAWAAGGMLMVYASALVKPHHAAYQKVQVWLDSYAATLVSKETRQDTGMCWQEATLSVYEPRR